jgi:hypothetical protein
MSATSLGMGARAHVRAYGGRSWMCALTIVQAHAGQRSFHCVAALACLAVEDCFRYLAGGLVGGVVRVAVRTGALDPCYLADSAFDVEVCERLPDVVEFAPFLWAVRLLGRER